MAMEHPMVQNALELARESPTLIKQSLGRLQRDPVAWFDHAGTHTGMVLFGTWLGISLCFQAIESLGLWKELKIQSVEKTSGATRWAGFWDSMFNWAWILATLVPPFVGDVIITAFPDTEMLGLEDSLKFAVFGLLLFDGWFFLFHKFLHMHPHLYIKFHKPHHLYTATFVWASHAQHPVEVMLNGIGTLGGPLIWGWLVHSNGFPLRSLWCWLAFVQYFGSIDHCGYDLPFLGIPLPFKVPFLTNSKSHDEHHRRLNVNYGGLLTVWDKLLGCHVD